MTWEVITDSPGGPANEGRAFVSDGTDYFHVDATNAQRLADLLNDGAKVVKAPRTKVAK